MNALSPHAVLLTALYEDGLGFLALFVICRLLPYMKRKAEQYEVYQRSFVTSSNPLVWIYRPAQFSFPGGVPKTVVVKKSMYMKTWVAFKGSQAFAWLILSLVTYSLLTSTGFHLPFLSNLNYNLLYATASNTPNGAHVSSYLALMLIGFVVAWKTKDVFLGGLAIAFAVGLHESLWMIFYYEAWSQYLTSAMATNILKDFPIFSLMLIMFILAFKYYPSNPYKLKDFIPVVGVYLGFLIIWFWLPHIFDPSYYQLLPIRTANLPSSLTTVTFGPYNETKYYWDVLTNVLEIVSWFIVTLGIVIVVARKRIPKSE